MNHDDILEAMTSPAPHVSGGVEDGPTVVIGGAQRSATNTLFFLLEDHPDIYALSIKEPQFFAFAGTLNPWNGPGADVFARSIVTSEPEYRRLFLAGARHQHRIEASTLYLSEHGVPERLMAFDPTVKVMFILRDPVDRAYSAFNFLRGRGWESLASVADAIKSEDERLSNGWPPHFGYIRLSSYGEHLQRWFGVVPRSQILCLNYLDLVEKPLKALRKVENFLDLDRFSAYEVGVQHNPSGEPRRPTLQRVLNARFPQRGRMRRLAPRFVHRGIVAMRNRNLVRPEELDPGERLVLIERLRPEIERVRALLGDTFVKGWDEA